MSPPSAFPSEIYDNIIDELAPSKDALSTCSLVQRSWAPRSRLHMFHNIDFKVGSTYEDEQQSSADRSAGFQEYIASNSAVASYARSLVLTFTNNESIASEIPRASQLSGLRSLTLKFSNSIGIYSVNDAILTRLLSFIRRNNHLEFISLQSVTIDPSALDVFIACVAIRNPELQSLHMQDIWAPGWTSNWSSQQNQKQFNPSYKSRSLARLCISCCESGVIPAFLRAFDTHRLERLALVSMDWDSCVMMLSATQEAVSLTHLTLDLSDYRQLYSSRARQEEYIFHRLASFSTLQLVLKSFCEAPSVLHKIYSSSLHRQPLLRKLHLQFQQYPSTTDTMVDKALKELCSAIPLLRISIGFNAQEGLRPMCATSFRSMEEIPTLFRSMNRGGALRFRSWDDWWAPAPESARNNK